MIVKALISPGNQIEQEPDRPQVMLNFPKEVAHGYRMFGERPITIIIFYDRVLLSRKSG